MDVFVTGNTVFEYDNEGWKMGAEHEVKDDNHKATFAELTEFMIHYHKATDKHIYKGSNQLTAGYSTSPAEG